GTTSPVNTLDVVGNANVTTNFTVDEGTLFVDSDSGEVGIGTTTPRNLLDVAGNVNINNTGGAVNTVVQIAAGVASKDARINWEDPDSTAGFRWQYSPDANLFEWYDNDNTKTFLEYDSDDQTFDILGTGGIDVTGVGTFGGTVSVINSATSSLIVNTDNDAQLILDSGGTAGLDSKIILKDAGTEQFEINWKGSSNVFQLYDDVNDVNLASYDADIPAQIFDLGSDQAGVDYYIKFGGETNDGTITYMEDEDQFKFNNDINATGDYIGGWTVIETQVISSGVASVVFGGLDDTYSIYKLHVFDMQPATDSQDINIKLRNATAAINQGGGHEWTGTCVAYGSEFHDIRQEHESWGMSHTGSDRPDVSNAGVGWSAEITLYDLGTGDYPSGKWHTTYDAKDGPYPAYCTGGGVCDASQCTGAVGFELWMDVGNINSGTFILTGLRSDNGT
ncbi:hypothetical protein ACFLZJ_01920, partial [Nanoarchaeota archaeon]